MRKSLVIILAGLVFVVILALAALLYFKPEIFTQFTSSLKTTKSIPVTVESPDTSLVFTPSNSFPNAAEFVERTKNLNGDDKVFKISISGDEKVAKNPFLKEGKIVSGFSFPDKKNVYHMIVYVKPEIQSDRGALQYEITRNYLLGMLYASEYQKFLNDPTYTPDYESSLKFMHQTTMSAVDEQKFPFIITKQE